jgi:hypothetical protein
VVHELCLLTKTKRRVIYPAFVFPAGAAMVLLFQ